LSQELSLKAQEPLVLKQRIYSGPEQKEYLQSFAPALEFVVDYGFFWPICSLILTVLVYINGFINNWGLSIILGTIAIRLLLIFLTIKQSHNLKKMQAIQPKLEAIKKNYNGDQAGFTQEVLAIYKAENLNPLTSLLSTIMAPIIQIPIFIAFYSVLMETVALRQAPFFGWIVDLSVKDPYYIIPVLVAGTAYVQQLISPKPQDEAMAFFMKMMPILLGLFCIQLPSGLGCYWATNNIISIIHTWKMQSGTITRSA
jgi:YidC/Oxa1 family membrane protein insertase